MPYVSHITVGDATVDIKDAEAREDITTLQEKVSSITSPSYSQATETITLGGGADA